MPATASHFKLGLFTLLAIVGLILIALGLGVHFGGRERVRYRTYFDESVHGLDLGAPVEYRGVPIGRVAAIRVAPDRAHVEVELEIERGDARSLALDAPAPGLRAQLGLQGVTGLKFVDLDLVDAAVDPPPALPFAPGARYVPSRRSLLEGLTAGLDAIGKQLPAVVEATVIGLAELERVLGQFRAEELPARATRLIDEVAGAVADLRGLLRAVRTEQLPAKLARAIEAATGTVDRLDEAVARIGGDRGLIASARRASDAVGDLGVGAGAAAEELERALREVGDAARALRELLDAVDREPDMLINGRARRHEP